MSAGTGVTAVLTDSSDQLLLPLAGPWIWVPRPVVNVRPFSVHTAPVSPQGGDGDSITVTAFCEAGSTPDLPVVEPTVLPAESRL